MYPPRMLSIPSKPYIKKPAPNNIQLTVFFRPRHGGLVQLYLLFLYPIQRFRIKQYNGFLAFLVFSRKCSGEPDRPPVFVFSFLLFLENKLWTTSFFVLFQNRKHPYIFRRFKKIRGNELAVYLAVRSVLNNPCLDCMYDQFWTDEIIWIFVPIIPAPINSQKYDD